ncbi:MAG: hypothetical protein K5893_12225 [Prevotella sp.]|nr:hypothetical protein [Prevotella sp.]
MKTKRYIASWVLLAVFVPMLVISSIHIHYGKAVESSCVECIHHHCGGHVGQHTASIHNCVLCQFLTLQFLAVAVATVVYYYKKSKILYARHQGTVCLYACGIPTLRAPPSV